MCLLVMHRNITGSFLLDKNECTDGFSRFLQHSRKQLSLKTHRTSAVYQIQGMKYKNLSSSWTTLI